MMINTELKPLPHAPSKKQLREMYWYYDPEFIKEEINRIIRENRGICKGKTVWAKTIRHIEFKRFVEFMKEYPKGYEKEFRK